MKAAHHDRYGPPEVLQVRDLPVPEPGPREVRVRVAASSVTSGDAKLRSGRPGALFWLPMRLMFGLLRPRRAIPGMEFSGRVDAIGAEVRGLKVGDAVFGMAPGGANAEYLTIAETAAIAPRPAGLDDAQAAALPFGAISALVFLDGIARLRPGERVLLHGASGGVGVSAVQVARHLGAHVTAVCSAANAELVRGLGADEVIDYTQADFTKGPARYDVILDIVGGTGVRRCRHLLQPGGRHVFLVYGVKELAWMAWTALAGGPRVVCGFAPDTAENLARVAALAAQGAIRPVIGQRFPLAEVAAAHRLVDSGRKRGSVVIEIGTPG